MSTPADRLGQAEALWGGEAGSSLGVNIRDAIAVAQQAGESGALAWQAAAMARPGVGGQAALPQPPSSAGGFGEPRPVVGMGYGVAAEPAPRQVAAYVSTPTYPADAVAGAGYPFGAATALRHVSDLGDGRLLIEGRSVVYDAVGYVSAEPARPRSWLRRLFRRP